MIIIAGNAALRCPCGLALERGLCTFGRGRGRASARARASPACESAATLAIARVAIEEGKGI